MKKLAFAVLAAVLFITACSKDDDNNTTTPPLPPPANAFSFHDTTVLTKNGYLIGNIQDGWSIALLDTTLTATYVGKLSGVGIDLDTLISGQTYTYLSDTAAAYDKTKNFYDGYAFYKSDWTADGVNENTGRVFNNITSGTVKYIKSGDTASVSYSLVFPSGTVTGTYIAPLVILD